MNTVTINAPVKVYRMSTPEHDCPWGLRAITLLTEQGIPFEDIVLRSPIVRPIIGSGRLQNRMGCHASQAAETDQLPRHQ